MLIMLDPKVDRTFLHSTPFVRTWNPNNFCFLWMTHCCWRLVSRCLRQCLSHLVPFRERPWLQPKFKLDINQPQSAPPLSWIVRHKPITLLLLSSYLSECDILPLVWLVIPVSPGVDHFILSYGHHGFSYQGSKHIWLVVWNMNCMTFHILGMSPSQLTNSYFSEGFKPTTRYL